MRKEYEKPVVETIEFQAEETIMTADVGGGILGPSSTNESVEDF